jgi:hypothetical protein
MKCDCGKPLTLTDIMCAGELSALRMSIAGSIEIREKHLEARGPDSRISWQLRMLKRAQVKVYEAIEKHNTEVREK